MFSNELKYLVGTNFSNKNFFIFFKFLTIVLLKFMKQNFLIKTTIFF